MLPHVDQRCTTDIHFIRLRPTYGPRPRRWERLLYRKHNHHNYNLRVICHLNRPSFEKRDNMTKYSKDKKKSLKGEHVVLTTHTGPVSADSY